MSNFDCDVIQTSWRNIYLYNTSIQQENKSQYNDLDEIITKFKGILMGKNAMNEKGEIIKEKILKNREKRNIPISNTIPTISDIYSSILVDCAKMKNESTEREFNADLSKLKEENLQAESIIFKFDSKITVTATKVINRSKGRKSTCNNKKKRVKLNHSAQVFDFLSRCCTLLPDCSIYTVLFDFFTSTLPGLSLFIEFYEHLIQNGASSIGVTKEEVLNKLTVKQADIDDVIYALDKNQISHERYTSFQAIVDPFHYRLPSYNKISQRRKKWKEITIKALKIRSQDRETICSLKSAIEAILLSQPNLQTSQLFKISMDGRKIDKNNEVHFAIIPLSVESFPSQSLESVFPLLIYEGTEEQIQTKIYHLCDEIDHIQTEGIMVNGKLITVEFVWVSDLKSYWLVFETPKSEFCPFCHITKRDRNKLGEYLPRNNGDCKIKIKRVNICNLHLKCRIVEKLLKNLTFNDPEIVDYLNDRLASHHIHLYYQQPKDPKSDQSTTTVKIKMINGETADRISVELEEYIIEMERRFGGTSKWELIKRICKIWNLIRVIIQLPSNKMISCDNDLKQMTTLWIHAIIEAWGSPRITYYMHIINKHLSSILLPGSLCIFSQQSVENTHKLHKMIKFRATNIADKSNSQYFITAYRRLLIKLSFIIKENNSILRNQIMELFNHI